MRIPKPHSTTPWYNCYWTINEKAFSDETNIPPRRRRSSDEQERNSKKAKDDVKKTYGNMEDCNSLDTDSNSSSGPC